MSNGLVRAVGLSLVILLVIAACGDPPPRALFTVNYYKTHQKTIVWRRSEECEGNPGEAENSGLPERSAGAEHQQLSLSLATGRARKGSRPPSHRGRYGLSRGALPGRYSP